MLIHADPESVKLLEFVSFICMSKKAKLLSYSGPDAYHTIMQTHPHPLHGILPHIQQRPIQILIRFKPITAISHSPADIVDYRTPRV